MTQEDPLPPGRLLAATFRTWARVLPWMVLALAVCCAPAVWWLETRGFGWPVVGLGLTGEAIAWTLVTPRALGQPGVGIRAVPRAVASLALTYAPLLAMALVMQLGEPVLRDVIGRWVAFGVLMIGVPVAAMMLGLDLHARFLVVVPMLVDRGQGLVEAARLTRQHRSALHGALFLVGLMWAGVVFVAMTFTMQHATWNAWHGFWEAVVYAWLIVSTLRGAMAAGVYRAIRAWWNPADLGRVFD